MRRTKDTRLIRFREEPRVIELEDLSEDENVKLYIESYRYGPVDWKEWDKPLIKELAERLHSPLLIKFGTRYLKNRPKTKLLDLIAEVTHPEVRKTSLQLLEPHIDRDGADYRIRTEQAENAESLSLLSLFIRPFTNDGDNQARIRYTTSNALLCCRKTICIKICRGRLSEDHRCSFKLCGELHNLLSVLQDDFIIQGEEKMHELVQDCLT